MKYVEKYIMTYDPCSIKSYISVYMLLSQKVVCLISRKSSLKKMFFLRIAKSILGNFHSSIYISTMWLTGVHRLGAGCAQKGVQGVFSKLIVIQFCIVFGGQFTTRDILNDVINHN